MSHRTNALAVVAAALVAAVAGVGVGALAAQTTSASAAGAGVTATPGVVDVVALQSPLADLNDALQRIDALLETVLDLVRTVSRLFGGGEAAD